MSAAGEARAQAADTLVAIGQRFYARRWVDGTSGNFSAVISREPVRLLMTPSGAHKGRLSPADFVEVDAEARAVAPTTGRPSAEARLHIEIVRARRAGAVLHTHSVWSTILSNAHVPTAGLAIAGYEMLKGLTGVSTHRHREWIPVIDNDQDMLALAGRVRDVLAAAPDAHAFLLAGHGLYTWGNTLDEAERHVEILEFLFEVIGHGHHPHP